MNLFVAGRRPRARHHRHRRAAPGGRVLQPPAGAPPPPLRRRPRLHGVLRLPPGRHQEGLARRCRADYEQWEVPYLPIDPKHVGRTYEAVIRVNSQSGKGGVAYIMEAEHGLDLPRRLQIEFSKTIQAITEDTGTEISPARCGTRSRPSTCPTTPAHRAEQPRAASRRRRPSTPITAQLVVDGEHRTVTGQGNGPIDAFVRRARAPGSGVELDVVDYAEHAMGAGADATAVAYVETIDGAGQTRWGVGTDPNIITASLRAVPSAMQPPTAGRTWPRWHGSSAGDLRRFARPRWPPSPAAVRALRSRPALDGAARYRAHLAPTRRRRDHPAGGRRTRRRVERRVGGRAGDPQASKATVPHAARGWSRSTAPARRLPGQGERQLGHLPRARRPVLRAHHARAVLRRAGGGRGRRVPSAQR